MKQGSQVNSRICRLRKKSQLTIKTVAEGLGVSESTYRSWEYGSPIRGEPYEDIAKFYGVSLNYILFGHNHGVERLKKQIQQLREELKKLQTEIEMSLLK